MLLLHSEILVNPFMASRGNNMAYFVISYDLYKAKHYQPVWDQLKAWGATRALESLWLAHLDGTAAQVRDVLKAIVDDDDSIVVIELKQGSGWGVKRASLAGHWLKDNILK
jgi:CRISPR/Cas system-associated endoribonuclease Cas2